MTIWESMTRMQDTADEHGFGEVWQTLLQTRTLEAARAASFKIHLSQLNAEGEDADDLMYMWTRVSCIIHDLDRPARKVTQ